MINFPQQNVFDTAHVDCEISKTDAEFIAGIGNSSSNGACLRLGLLPENARRDIKQKKIKDQKVDKFLHLASTKRWYPEWKDWILSNQVHKVDDTKLPPYSGDESLTQATRTLENEPSCYQPTPEYAERVMEKMYPNDDEVPPDDLKSQIELEAKENGKTLCSDWWGNLLAAIEGKEVLG